MAGHKRQLDTDVSCQLYRLVTEHVSEHTDIKQLVSDHFHEDEIGNIIITGLHTCGNLAPTSLRLFINDPENLTCLFNIGCCYNLLSEEFDPNVDMCNDKSVSSDFGFPMSVYLKKLKFLLGRNARMLAAQAQDRVSHTRMVCCLFVTCIY